MTPSERLRALVSKIQRPMVTVYSREPGRSCRGYLSSCHGGRTSLAKSFTVAGHHLFCECCAYILKPHGPRQCILNHETGHLIVRTATNHIPTIINHLSPQIFPMFLNCKCLVVSGVLLTLNDKAHASITGSIVTCANTSCRCS